MRTRLCLLSVVLLSVPLSLRAAGPLVVVEKGQGKAVIVVAAAAGEWEKRAGADLAKTIETMSGARLPVVESAPAGSAALVVGQAALKEDPSLAAALAKVVKKDPVLRADAIVLRRRGDRVYLVGSNDDGHYYAAAELLRRWGCRWFLPTDFGACIPEKTTLAVEELEYAYAPPFEVRSYWIAWNGSNDGQAEFQRRNGMNPGVGVPSGHAIGKYMKELIPKGKSVFDVPIADEATAEHVAKQVAPLFAEGKDFSLGMEDGIYRSESPRDKELQAGLQDKYFLVPSQTDAFLTLYNGVAERLLKQYPQSTSKIGFLAYSNMTLPPQRGLTAAKPLVAYLAAIDIDPIHGMDDPKSPPRQEYREMMYQWAKAMQGRVVIYDYDQGMLVWRDLPNPSLASIRQDIPHYRKAGILGVATESRGAMATVFLNLYLRARLLWDPDADVDALLAEFYPAFYGPAAEPMAAYWDTLHRAWADSIVTEHEHFVAPAVYTPEVIATLKRHLEEAERRVAPLRTKAEPSRNEKLVLDRLRFTRLSWELIDAYLAMVRAAAGEGDYRAAVAAGERGLQVRLELAKMNPTFTTRVVGVAAEGEATGPAWWPGEVKQYRDLLALTDGGKGTLLVRTPKEWAFRRDPHDTGLPSGWAYRPIDLSWWNARADRGSVASHRQNPGHWEMLRTDLYPQAQGVVSPDYHSYTGHAWYRTEVTLTPEQARGPVRLMFPGLFNECWLYVNGTLAAHRTQKPVWWLNDYRFEWDVDLAGRVKPGVNTLTLRLFNPHHFGGIFRRPFLYRPAS